MIGAILVKLNPQQEIKVKGRGGELLGRILVEVLNRENFPSAIDLGQLNDESPLSVSPFLKGVKYVKGFSCLSPFKATSFRICYLQEKFLELIMRGFLSLSSTGEPIKIEGGTFLVEKVDMQKSPEAGFTSFEDILAQAGQEERIVLEFWTPTLFRQGKEKLLFPLPQLVFSSLWRRWNLFSEIEVPPTIKADFNRIDVLRFRLKTEEVSLSTGSIAGFVGQVDFRLQQTIPPRNRRVINALADFAYYSGLGCHLTKGMGQVRRVVK